MAANPTVKTAAAIRRKNPRRARTGLGRRAGAAGVRRGGSDRGDFDAGGLGGGDGGWTGNDCGATARPRGGSGGGGRRGGGGGGGGGR